MKLSAWDYSAGGAIVPEDSCINSVDGFPELDVSERYVHLEDAVPVAAGSPEDCVHVAECLFSLLLDRAELLLASRRIDRKLSRNKHETVVDGCLRVVPGWLRSVWRVDSLNIHGG